MPILVHSKTFSDGQKVPLRNTGDAEDLSPQLSWVNLPGTTQELALIVDDPDAPTTEPWVHWVLYKIPPDTQDLPEGLPRTASLSRPEGALQGKNSWGSLGYRGPAPPKGHGVHHYRFRVYALDAPLNVRPGMDKKALLAAMSGHIVAEGELVGIYQR